MTRWLGYVFQYLNEILPYCVYYFAKEDSKYWQLLKDPQTYLKFRKSGKISPNLVTLALTTKPFETNLCRPRRLFICLKAKMERNEKISEP